MKKAAVLAVIFCVLPWMAAMADSTPPTASSMPENILNNATAVTSQPIPQTPGENKINPGERAPIQPEIPPPPVKQEFSGPPNVPDPNVILQGGDNFLLATLIRSLPYYDNGFTTNYSDDYIGNCGGGGSAPDVVYKYTPPIDLLVDIHLCSGTDYDSKLYVCVNADPDSILACNDDACGPQGFQSELVGLHFDAGTEYYIVVDGYGSSSGNYGIEVTGVEPPPCEGDNVGYYNGYPDGVTGLSAFRSADQNYDRWIIDDISFPEDVSVTGFHWYAVATTGFDWNNSGDFIILADNSGIPGDTIYLANGVPNSRVATGNTRWNMNEYIYTIQGLNIPLHAGRYWLGVRPVSTSSPNSYTETTSPINGTPLYVSYPDLGHPAWTPGYQVFGTNYDISFCVTVALTGPGACLGDNVIYSNGPDALYAWASQCDHSNPFAAGTADDFILPAGDDYNISTVAAFLGLFYGGDPGPNFTGIVVTIYANNADSIPNEPGGHPVDGDPNCAHVETLPGGIISTQTLTPEQYSYSQVGPYGNYQFILPISPVRLNGGTTYWLEVQPIMDYATHNQCGFVPTNQVTGNSALIYFPLIGYPEWSDIVRTDMAFCLLGEVAPPGCQYLVGDINGNGQTNGIDVTFGVSFLKGGAPPRIDCNPPCMVQPNPFYAAGDVNGNCAFNGIDITYFVSYLKGGPALLFCPDCPPVSGAAPASGDEQSR